MKQLSLILIFTLVIASVVFAQTVSSDKTVKKVIIKTGENPMILAQSEGEDLDEIVEATDDLQKEFNVTVTTSDDDDAAFMGIFSEDLTLSQAAQKGYNKMYGVLITGISPNTPAKKYKLMADDILVQIDHSKLSNKEQLLKILQSYSAGDSVNIIVFRDGVERTMPFVFGSRKHNDQGTVTVTQGKPEVKVKKKRSVGYGGGTWMPIMFDLNTDDVSKLFVDNGFHRINNNGLFLNGGGGKGPIGKGLFIGGMGAGYTMEKKFRAPDSLTSSATSQDYDHKATYRTSFGGVTLDKRFPLFRHCTGSLGFMLGGGGQSATIKVTRYDYPTNGYDWTQMNLVELQEKEVTVKRHYIVFQPKAEVLYHLTGWLALRGEVGYMMGYSSKEGWTVKNDGNAQIPNSPDSSFNALTYSVGPWFGF